MSIIIFMACCLACFGLGYAYRGKKAQKEKSLLMSALRGKESTILVLKSKVAALSKFGGLKEVSLKGLQQTNERLKNRIDGPLIL